MFLCMTILMYVTNHLYLLVSICVSVCLSACIVPIVSDRILSYHMVPFRWNSSAMRRWLKENFLTPGDGTPLHSIDAIEDLQRALASFSGTVQCSAVQHRSVLYLLYSALCSSVLCALCCFDLLYFLLQCSALLYSTLLYFSLIIQLCFLSFPYTIYFILLDQHFSPHISLS